MISSLSSPFFSFIFLIFPNFIKTVKREKKARGYLKKFDCIRFSLNCNYLGDNFFYYYQKQMFKDCNEGGGGGGGGGAMEEGGEQRRWLLKWFFFHF